jgi:hypothetical protein
VGVDTDGLLAEGVAENDIRRLPPHAWQGNKIVEIVRDLAAEALDQFFTAVVNRFGFVTIKVDLADLLYQPCRPRSGVIGRVSIGLEQVDGDFVDQIVARLSGQDQSDQQFEGIGKVESEPGVGMDFLESCEDFFDPRVGSWL